ncbi:MAG: hypothetical protein ACXWC7_09415 [Chitinophagaceae bacterium]
MVDISFGIAKKRRPFSSGEGKEGWGQVADGTMNGASQQTMP